MIINFELDPSEPPVAAGKLVGSMLIPTVFIVLMLSGIRAKRWGLLTIVASFDFVLALIQGNLLIPIIQGVLVLLPSTRVFLTRTPSRTES